MSFVFSDPCENGITREKVLAKCSGKSPLSEHLGFQSDASGIFNASNAWTNMWNKMMKEKAGAERQNFKKGFDRMSMPAAWREYSWFRIFLPVRI